jgi:hypothetical protein
MLPQDSIQFAKNQDSRFYKNRKKIIFKGINNPADDFSSAGD